ncbi:hypothetical protein [Microseira wollei]|uniref:hypothetical protein n=1 Tax=Microseira wollei TaxID=467598 RepID=UPI001CFD4633|nr:hypothetical protein [Microseira wollei]
MWDGQETPSLWGRILCHGGAGGTPTPPEIITLVGWAGNPVIVGQDFMSWWGRRDAYPTRNNHSCGMGILPIMVGQAGCLPHKK